MRYRDRRLRAGGTPLRPALFPEGLRQSLHELRAFRHVFVHAYDLDVDPEKLALVLKYGRRVADALPGMATSFVATVAREQGLEPAR